MAENKGARLKNKVAIITGGALGIGYSYAVGFANEGAKLVIADINFEAANTAVKNLGEMGAEAIATNTDVANMEDVQEMVKKTDERFGKVDILVNNAGFLSRSNISRGVPFYELDLKEWDRCMAVNVNGAFFCSRAVFPYMKRQGGGRIINITSGQVYVGGGKVKYIHYLASKAAVIGITRALARELGEYNINVNCISPGSILSEDPGDKAAIEYRKLAIPERCIQRLEYPEDLVGTAIFLASSDSDFITGQTISVDGGAIML
jgi:3-oxoacyl-[acyl-carrier protein] reductase